MFEFSSCFDFKTIPFWNFEAKVDIVRTLDEHIFIFLNAPITHSPNQFLKYLDNGDTPCKSLLRSLKLPKKYHQFDFQPKRTTNDRYIPKNYIIFCAHHDKHPFCAYFRVHKVEVMKSMIHYRNIYIYFFFGSDPINASCSFLG